MKKRILIFGNGTLHKKFLLNIQNEDYIIGVDRAAYWLIENKIIPDIAIGDFDSVTKKEFQTIKKSVKNFKQFSPEKDWTDMELAVKHAAGLQPGKVIIFGGTGTRLDHMLATLHLLKNHVLIDETNRIRRIGRGTTVIEKSSYRYISIIPYTKIISLSLKGFRYNVAQKIIRQGETIGVSNELVGGQGIIDIFAGKAWVVESND